MSDTQRARLLAAEEDVWNADERLDLAGAHDLVEEAGIVRGLDLTLVPVAGDGHVKVFRTRDGGEIWAPSWALRRLPLLHEVAHLLVHPLFPAHGAEFAAELLELVRAHASPALETRLRAAFTARGVHHCPDQRRARARRDAVFYANNRPGTLLEIIAADPPELIVGAIQLCASEMVHLGDELIALNRLRYVRHLAAAAAHLGQDMEP